MVLLLIVHIAHRSAKLALPQRKHPIPLLPLKPLCPRHLISVMGTAALKTFHKIGHRQSRRNRRHHMNMVFGTINGVDNAAQVVSLTRHVAVQIGLPARLNQRQAIFGCPDQMVIELPTSHRMNGSKMLCLICPDGRWVAHLMPKMGGWVMADTPNPGIKMAGLIAHVPAGQFPQSSSEDFCYEPWNSIPGRSRRSPDNPHQLARWGDNTHQSMRWGDCPQPFMGWVAHLMPKMGGWVMAQTPNPGIKMAGLISC